MIQFRKPNLTQPTYLPRMQQTKQLLVNDIEPAHKAHTALSRRLVITQERTLIAKGSHPKLNPQTICPTQQIQYIHIDYSL